MEATQMALNVPKSNDLSTKLAEAASQDPVLKAICLLFANRQRARGNVTVHSLQLSMRKFGAGFPRKDLERALKTLASLGIGSVAYNLKGRMVGLKGIKQTLQSVGKAATTGEAIKRYNQANHFVNIPKPNMDFAVPPTIRPAIAEFMTGKRLVKTPDQKTVLKVLMGGQEITIESSRKLSPNQITALINDMYVTEE